MAPQTPPQFSTFMCTYLLYTYNKIRKTTTYVCTVPPAHLKTCLIYKSVQKRSLQKKKS